MTEKKYLEIYYKYKYCWHGKFRVRIKRINVKAKSKHHIFIIHSLDTLFKYHFTTNIFGLFSLPVKFMMSYLYEPL